jgi:hypothetical protein
MGVLERPVVCAVLPKALPLAENGEAASHDAVREAGQMGRRRSEAAD